MRNVEINNITRNHFHRTKEHNNTPERFVKGPSLLVIYHSAHIQILHALYYTLIVLVQNLMYCLVEVHLNGIHLPSFHLSASYVEPLQGGEAMPS